MGLKLIYTRQSPAWEFDQVCRADPIENHDMTGSKGRSREDCQRRFTAFPEVD